MTIEQLLNGSQIINDIEKELNNKTAAEEAAGRVQDTFKCMKRNIVYTLRNLLEGKCIAFGRNIDYRQDKELMKDAIEFIKKQAFDNLDILDKKYNTFFECSSEDKDSNEEKEVEVKKIEIPVNTQVPAETATMVAPVNFSY